MTLSLGALAARYTLEPKVTYRLKDTPERSLRCFDLKFLEYTITADSIPELTKEKGQKEATLLSTFAVA